MEARRRAVLRLPVPVGFERRIVLPATFGDPRSGSGLLSGHRIL